MNFLPNVNAVRCFELTSRFDQPVQTFRPTLCWYDQGGETRQTPIFRIVNVDEMHGATMTGKKVKGNQSQRFIEKAHELGCDEDEAAFEKRLREIAEAPPKAERSKAVGPRKRSQ